MYGSRGFWRLVCRKRGRLGHKQAVSQGLIFVINSKELKSELNILKNIWKDNEFKNY
jgi:hypothetical protein